MFTRYMMKFLAGGLYKIEHKIQMVKAQAKTGHRVTRYLALGFRALRAFLYDKPAALHQPTPPATLASTPALN